MIDTPTRPKPAARLKDAASDLTDAERIGIDRCYEAFKASGGHHRDNDSQALRLQQQYQTKDFP